MEAVKMAKTVTLRKRKRSATKSLRAYEPFANKELKDPKLVIEALLDCIRSGDIESFREVLVSHLMTANKMAIAKKAGIGRRTLYDLIDPKKEFNPELSTISAVIRALAA
jgi:DNA-binding phage protein